MALRLLPYLGVLLLIVAALPSSAHRSVDDERAEVVAADATSRRGLLAKCSSNKTPDYRGKCVCKSGYEFSFGTCKQCKAGYHKSGRGNKSCSKCLFGQYQTSSGSTSCHTCSSPKLVNPHRTKCQGSCKSVNDHSVIHYGPFWSVNTEVYYYGDINASSTTTAAKVCDSTHTDGASNLIPALINSESERRTAAKLVEYHFKCLRQPEGSTNFDYAFFTWVLMAPGGAYPADGQCNYMFHTAGAGGDGQVTTLIGSQCFGPMSSGGEFLPVLCSQGCKRFCSACSSGKCTRCVPGYSLSNGSCKELFF